MILALYRVRGLLYLVAGAVLILSIFLPVPEVLVLLSLSTVVLCLVLVRFGPRLLPEREVTVVSSPVEGRWMGLNSPATKVPSHGVRAYGQAYAIDLVHEPMDAARPVFGDGPAMRSSEDYPAFGQPVFAMIDGVVVKASGRRRDHRARSSSWALLYMFAEGAFREIGGPGFILGNHVVIQGSDGVFAAVAHLQHGSPTVRPGDRVSAGAEIGRCGNSGNSSEPHVHAQLMDRASPLTGQGLPMAFRGIALDEEPVDALPGDEQHMTATAMNPGRPGGRS